MTITSEDARVEYTSTGLTTYVIPFRIINATDISVIVTTPAGVETLQILVTDYSVSGLSDPTGLVTFLSAPSVGDFVSIFLDPTVTQLTSYAANGPFLSSAHENALDSLLLVIKRAIDLTGRGLTLTDGSVAAIGSYDADGRRLVNLADPTGDQDSATKAFVNSEIMLASVTPYPGPITAAAGTILDDATTDDMLTTLGGLATGIALFKSSNAAIALIVLGISTFVRTLLTAIDAPAFRALIDAGESTALPVENYLINGDFQVSQNGKTFTAPADASYFSDQWVVLTESAGAVDIQVETTQVLENSRGGISVTQAAGMGNTKWGLFQVVDGQRSAGTSSRKFSASIDIAAPGDLTNFKLIVLAWKSPGVVDAPTMDPVNVWGGSTTRPTFVTGWNFVDEFDFTAAAGAATYSLIDVTLPASVLNVGFLLVTNDSSFSAGAQTFLGKANLIPGTIAARFSPRSYEAELRDCQKFFRSTFPRDIAPIDNAGTEGSLMTRSSDDSTTTTKGWLYWDYGVEMLKTPAVVTYNPGAGTVNNWRDIGDANDRPRVITGADKSGVLIETDAVGSIFDTYRIHATADARF